MDITKYLEEKKKVIDSALESSLIPLKEHSILYAAMAYSLLLGGKRIRPILAITTYSASGKNEADILPFACAIEMIHTYSLIHDDLPIMDNSDERRGKSSCHKVYGSDMALLAGDALLSYSFEMASNPIHRNLFDEKLLLEVVNNFALSSGVKGLVGGQVMDMISSVDEEINEETITYIDRLKTASLISLAIRTGGILAGVNESEKLALSRFGENLGISYQIIDDVLDETSSPEILGKETQQDKKNKKATFVALFGVEKSKNIAQELILKAVDFLKPYNNKYTTIIELAEFTLGRMK